MKHFLIFLVLITLTNCTVDDNNILEQPQNIDQPQDVEQSQEPDNTILETTSYTYKGKTYDSTDAIQGLDLDKVDIVYFEEQAFIFDDREDTNAFAEKGILPGERGQRMSANQIFHAIFVNLFTEKNERGRKRLFITVMRTGSKSFRLPQFLANKVSSVRAWRNNRSKVSNFRITTNGGTLHFARAIPKGGIAKFNLTGSQNNKGNVLRINAFKR